MKGIHLRSIAGTLFPVHPRYDKKPMGAIRNIPRKLIYLKTYLDSYFYEFNFAKHYPDLPLAAFRNFSFDELTKLKFSSVFMMDDTVQKLFERRLDYEVVRKIMSSMWRWGYSRGTWNEVVDAYNCIRNFSLGNREDFDIRLDYTTWVNEFGYSKFSRTYLDGVFAYLVYYKQEHVMTIGFSIMENRRILIQQIQLRKQSGNRWLYKLPRNRVEFVLEQFQRCFPGFTLFIVDGQALAQKTLKAYRALLQRDRTRLKDYQSRTEDKDSYQYLIERTMEDIELLTEKIAHLESDEGRLARFYADTGTFRCGEALTINSLVHYQVSESVPQPLLSAAQSFHQ